ncbi:unnamed protein product, partial [Rotaria magnacalcarata]
ASNNYIIGFELKSSHAALKSYILSKRHFFITILIPSASTAQKEFELKITNGTLPMVSNENLLIMLQTAILLMLRTVVLVISNGNLLMMPRTIVLLIVQKIKTEVSNENLLISLRTVVLLVLNVNLVTVSLKWKSSNVTVSMSIVIAANQILRNSYGEVNY